MIKMTIIMDEEKIKAESSLSVEETYQKIDDIAKEVGITTKEDFTYIGDEHIDDGYVKFMKLLDKLEECKWFLNSVLKWTYEDNEDYADWKELCIRDGLM